jgi:hypothetical protein
MADPTIILQTGQILLTQTSGSSGIMPIKNIRLGMVVKVSDLSDSNLLGNTVMYNEADAQSFMYGSTIYYIIDETNVSGVEEAL